MGGSGARRRVVRLVVIAEGGAIRHAGEVRVRQGRPIRHLQGEHIDRHTGLHAQPDCARQDIDPSVPAGCPGRTRSDSDLLRHRELSRHAGGLFQSGSSPSSRWSPRDASRLLVASKSRRISADGPDPLYKPTSLYLDYPPNREPCARSHIFFNQLLAPRPRAEGQDPSALQSDGRHPSSITIAFGPFRFWTLSVAYTRARIAAGSCDQTLISNLTVCRASQPLERLASSVPKV